MLRITKINSDCTIDFAAEELKKDLRMMMPEAGDVKIFYDAEGKEGFRLGLMESFGLDLSDATDPRVDNVLYIDCDENGGIISGSNPRSVLLSVYEYLRKNGCRWLFPGVDGELIPIQDIIPVKYRHLASCRFRGECLEGTNNQRTLLDAIDFAPKIGMNIFMMQFKVPNIYYNMYYSHLFNSENRPSEPIGDNQVLQWKRQCESEIAKRGLQFHDIGHGWTVEPFGIKFEANWNKVDPSAVPKENVQYLSEINGKRCLFEDKPINTNFCMSNPHARKKFVDYVSDYAEGHSNIDYIHVWLADGANNSCECKECKKMRPSDWYVMLMNELDNELSLRGLDNRIVFIQYLDTTWAPQIETVKNPGRFALMTAPITRSYEFSLPKGGTDVSASEYIRNKNEMPKTLGQYLAHLSEWQRRWGGSTFSFEYYFWLNQCFDVSGLHLARLINEDVRSYKSMDVDGLISCGSQRSFFPTGVSFYSMGRSLLDSSITAEEIIEDYFRHAFGKDWQDFVNYLERLGEAMPYRILDLQRGEGHHTIVNEENVKQLLLVKDIVKDGRRLIKEHYNSDTRVTTVAVRLLEKHAEYCERIAEAVIERAKGNIEEALSLLDKFRIEFGKYEPEIEEYFDHFLNFRAIKMLVDKCSYKFDVGN